MWGLQGSELPWTNEFPKGVKSACVSYSLILCTTLGTAHDFNDQSGFAELDINWARLLFLVGDFVVCSHACGCVYELFTHSLCLTHILDFVCCVAANEGFISRHCAQYVFSPRCDCAVGWPRPCWRRVRFTHRGSEQVSDRDKLSGSIPQTPIVSF